MAERRVHTLEAIKPDRGRTHLAGEYFVGAELSRRGYAVAFTIGNAKAIDLFAEKNGRAINVQVKAINSKKSIGWPMDVRKVLPNIVYVFVCLNAPGMQPDYFICTSEEARHKVKQYATRGIVDLTTLRTSDFQERWDKIEDACTVSGA